MGSRTKVSMLNSKVVTVLIQIGLASMILSMALMRSCFRPNVNVVIFKRGIWTIRQRFEDYMLLVLKIEEIMN